MLCTKNSLSIVGQLYFKNRDKLIEKEIRFGTSTCGSGGWSKGTTDFQLEDKQVLAV